MHISPHCECNATGDYAERRRKGQVAVAEARKGEHGIAKYAHAYANDGARGRCSCIDIAHVFFFWLLFPSPLTACQACQTCQAS